MNETTFGVCVSCLHRLPSSVSVSVRTLSWNQMKPISVGMSNGKYYDVVNFWVHGERLGKSQLLHVFFFLVLKRFFL